MTFTCPTCQRTIYNRRRVTCEFCGETIPNELLFNPAQIAAIERLKTLEEKEHRVHAAANVERNNAVAWRIVLLI